MPSDTNWVTLLATNDRRGGVAAARRQPPGELVWKAALGDSIRSSPVLRDGVLYVACRDGRLYAFDAANGRERWRSALGDSAVDRAVQADVLDDGSAVVVGYSRARGLANDAPVWTTRLHGAGADGRPTWSLPLGGPGRESGRWIARHGDELWVVGQEAAADSGSRVFVARVAVPR